jgi:hypothetical protein
MNFEFDEQQIQYVVNTLAQRPYAEVFDLMNNIQRQAAQQRQQPRVQAVPAGPQDIPTGT